MNKVDDFLLSFYYDKESFFQQRERVKNIKESLRNPNIVDILRKPYIVTHYI